MDVGCFGPFETLYQQEVHKCMRHSIGRSVTRYDVCELVCKVYEHALSPSNLRSSFKKTGIFPIDSNVINPNCTVPSLIYTGKALLENSTTSTDKHVEGGNNLLHSNNVLVQEHSENIAANFFQKRGGDVLKYVAVAKKPRKNISTIIAGKAITEPDVYEKVQAYQKSSEDKKKSKTKGNTVNKAKGMKGTNTIVQPPVNPRPSTSKSPTPSENSTIDFEPSDDDCSIKDEEKCCVCGEFEPVALKKKLHIEFVKWAQCDICEHWVHLSYCVVEKVVRMDTQIVCPHCKTK